MTVTQTAYGKVRGAEIADGVLAWRGIPYAAPPVGELRLRPPRPPQAWSGIRDALGYGNRSLQPDLATVSPGPPQPPAAEDCLYLNVTAPAGAAPAGGRPVLLWIHGGGFEMGHGPDQAEDGAAFARSHGLVVVTFNYRLGALGFLDVPGERPTGALGLHDQVAALRWTRDNIAAFGGDPGQITVYGLSAGGKSVTNLLASPLTKGLIRRAAESSGGDHVKDQAQAASVAARFFSVLGTTPSGSGPCPPPTSWPRSSPWRRRRGQPGCGGRLSTDRADRGSRGRDRGRRGGRCAAAAADLRQGDRAVPADRPGRRRQAEGVLTGYFGAERAAAMLASYAAAYPQLDETALRGVAVMSDERYVVRTERLADAHAAHAPVWRSRYDGPYTGIEDDPDPEFAQYAGVLGGAHGGDGAGIWRGGDGPAAALHDAWGAFATQGDPAGPGTPPTPGRR